jgi:7,8-dihydropterin-6-yl-methyl-4-(beta-D-ribofuranosyl)aminobenzene 5'-phosphate synthase
MDTVKLREADRLEVTILIDNYTDAFLPSTDVVKRPLAIPPNFLLAEHGLSCVLKVFADSEEHTVLLDAGISKTCFFHNSNLLNIDFSKIESIALSHGHFDHYGALIDFLEGTTQDTSLFLHPDAFLERRLNIQAIGVIIDMGVLSEAALMGTRVKVNKIAEASTLASGLMMVTGEAKRVTDFEKGFPWAEAKIDDKWVIDPFRDDQGIAINIKGKGLVVLGGCSHAGIINIVKHAQKVTSTDKVHAVLGGFHLTGALFEPIIEPTIEEMEKINPDIIVPMHCTGWKAINRFAERMPKQFILNGVGSTYIFQSV